MTPLDLKETAQWLLMHDNYIMLTHRRPDGDTIGCAVALCRGLRALGKQAWIYANPQFTPKFSGYLKGLTREGLGNEAHLVAVDIATGGLLPYGTEDYVNQIDLRIDHHGRDKAFGSLAWVDASAAACGELVLQLLGQLEVPLDKAMAEAIYLAVSTDTGCFRYSNVTANTLRAAAVCKEAGADTFAINRAMFLTKRMARLRLEAHLTHTTEFYAGGKVAVSAISDALKAELGLTEDDIDDISGFGREIEGVEIAVMLRQTPEGGKISLRTSPDFDAASICARLGGGGHRAAAGATVPGNLEAAKNAVLLAIAAQGVSL